jgi:citrate synthase
MDLETQHQVDGPSGSSPTGSDSVTIKDNRTGQSYELPVVDGTIRAIDLRQIKAGSGDFGLMSYDPAYTNTVECRSAITYVDGDAGILQYRGIPIEQLCERSTYLEVAYLLIYGRLPTETELELWVDEITHHTFVHENVKTFMQGFRYDGHPMGILLASVGALSTFYPGGKDIDDERERRLAAVRLIAKMPTLAAYAYRHMRGLPYIYPDNRLSYLGNFLSMLFKVGEPTYEPDPRLQRALDVLFILHADHEQNCSTAAVRGVGSSGVDPYSALAAGIAALYGPLHGGANEAVLKMLGEIKASGESVEKFVERVKNKEDGVRLMGFGHRVYKNFDPRAKLVKESADEVLKALGVQDDLLDIAKELEAVALADDYFIERKLYPNVDFYTGVIYKAMGFPPRMFTVLFAIGRLPGWIAHWREMNEDPATKIGRPQQLYTGAPARNWPAR